MTRNGILKLDIGCGNTMTPGYLRMDVNADLADLDYVGPMTRIPLPDDSLEEIRASHVIEHVPSLAARQVLKEFHRVLKPGGFAWLDTPNLSRNAALYLNGGWEEDFRRLSSKEQEYCSLNGTPNKTLWVNFKMFSSPAQWDTHFANYDASLLAAFCHEAGFLTTEILQQEPSLILKATK